MDQLNDTLFDILDNIPLNMNFSDVNNIYILLIINMSPIECTFFNYKTDII